MSDYTIVIGLEVHTQLLTNSKLFCGCANRFNPDNPNVQTCPVCLGLPGALPVMNQHAFDLALETAMALNCQIAEFTKWDRKQYYYPDLPKAYQISQFDLPFSFEGWLDVEVDSDTDEKETTRIRINRVHLEEDAGKNIHEAGESHVDLNRTGTPLLEIVSEPDLRSAQAARRYLEEIRLLLTYLGVSDCNMQEGSLRCDANVNLHIPDGNGGTVATPIVEIKNMNSFRNVELALEYEAKRQWKVWQETGKKIGEVPKQTRGWDADKNESFGQREKEESSDYRYFPDPDLVPVLTTSEQLDTIRGRMCELPAVRRTRFRDEFSLSEYDASVIIDQGPDLAAYFETVAKNCGDSKVAANWVTQDVLREINERKQAIGEFAINSEILSALLSRLTDGTITNKSAREVFSILLKLVDDNETIAATDIDTIIEREGLAKDGDSDKILAIIDAVIGRNEAIANDVRGGKQQAAGPLIGQVMKELKGADPKEVRQMILDRLSG